MLSNELVFIPPQTIIVDRQARQRRQFTTEDLDDSIRLRGIINPLIITRDLELKAGERRLTSALKVGLATVPCRYVDTLDPIELQIIELEENIKRTDLNWRDETRAIAKIHELYAYNNPTWTQLRTGQSIGLSSGQVAVYLRVARDLDSVVLAAASSVNSAYNLLTRKDDRKIGDAIADILEAGQAIIGGVGIGVAADGEKPATGQNSGQISHIQGTPAPHTMGTPTHSVAPVAATRPPQEHILNENFLLWAPQYTGPRFNFLHCDFPYGINAFDGSLGAAGVNSSSDMNLSSAKAQLYIDKPETYWELIDCLCGNIDKIMSPSAHIMFWLSMHHYEETLAVLSRKAPSLTFNPIPLIWLKSDNRGVISDARRGPRNIYETALFGYREDRPIVKSTSNGYSCPTDKTYHHSTKPEPMLRYFFQMFVDESTSILDPTCGGGSSLRAAESLGCSRILGLEIDVEHCENARRALRQARLLKQANKLV